MWEETMGMILWVILSAYLINISSQRMGLKQETQFRLASTCLALPML